MRTRSRLLFVVTFTCIAAMFAGAMSALGQGSPPYNPHQYQFGTESFIDVWERTDRPVQEGATERTWLWGPGANTPLLQEPYQEADDGERDVQYTDKSRMEMPWDEDVDQGSPWFITQGLLAYELMSGRVQVGDAAFEDAFPAQIQIAGDPNSQGPTYATLGMHLESAPRADGTVIIDFLHTGGHVESLQHLDQYGVTDVDGTWQNVDGIDQPIASVFWDFMTSSGPIYEDGILQTGQVVESPFYAVGYPLTPAFWTWVKVNNVEQNVLIQCFERRCLTYTPDNAPEWRVESGNVGQHYFEWRYNQVGQPAPPDDDGVDDDVPAIEPASFSVSPGVSTNLVGSSHTITVTVEGTDEEPFAGAGVTASVTDGPHDGTVLTAASTTTDAAGQVQLSYTGTEDGTDTITVEVEGIEAAQTVTKTWAEYTLVIDPADATNTVGTTHEVEISVIDGNQEQVDIGSTNDVDVNVNREYVIIDEGPDIDPPWFSLEDGVVTLTYDGPDEPATDTIEVVATVDGIELTGTATKTWAPYTLNLDPDHAFNVIETEHTIEASIKEHDGTEVVIADDADISVEVMRAFEDESEPAVSLTGEDGAIEVNIADGDATIIIDGPDQPAEDTIEITIPVNGIDVTGSVTKTWTSAPNSLELTIDPAGEASVDDTVTLTANVIDVDSDPVPGIEVEFDSSVQGDLGIVVTNVDGDAIIPGHTYTVAEDEEITAIVVDPDNLTPPSDSGTIDWVAGAATNLTLDLWDHPTIPQSDVNEIDDRHHVAATVEDQYANKVPGVPVTFSLTTDDANDPVENLAIYGTFDTEPAYPVTYDSTEGTTNALGKIGFLYEGESPGSDIIIATVTDSTDPNLTDTSDKFWCSAIVENGESIQQAVDGVSEGAIVCVETGTYDEHVTVTTDDITFLGANAGVDPRDGNRTDESIVGAADAAFTLNANNITIDGFEITGATPSGNTGAISTSENHSGFSILNNYIHDNSVGLRLRSEGTYPTIVSTNFFKDNNQAGDGVAKALGAGFGAVRNTVIEDNLFEGHTQGANSYTINLLTPSNPSDPLSDHQNIQILNNVMDTSMVLNDVDGLTVSGNIIDMENDSDSTSAIFIGGAVQNAVISDNVMRNAGRGLGIFTIFSGGNQDITVTGNQIIDNTVGVEIDDDVSSGNITVNNNKVEGNDTGLINDDTETLNATSNWWGASDGPSPTGSGDEVVGNVDVTGFLTTDPF